MEILKGPQGTLFGRNATGGLVHYITRKPTEETQFYGDVIYGKYDQVRFEGAAGAALSANVKARVAGFVDNFPDTRNMNIGFSLPFVCGCGEQSFGYPRMTGSGCVTAISKVTDVAKLSRHPGASDDIW